MTDLLPCPFCGKDMMLRSALWPSEGDTDSIIHAEPTECPMYDFCDGTADGSIVGRWNSRPDAYAIGFRDAIALATKQVRFAERAADHRPRTPGMIAVRNWLNELAGDIAKIPLPARNGE